MELDWLETFLAVVDRRGFTAASEHLHRSQSRVSAHIAGLERDLGVRLIDRTRRPATVTPAGQLLARHAREILAAVAAARAEVSALRSMDRESLCLLSTPCIAGTLLPRVTAVLADRHPGVRITVSERAELEGFPTEGVAVAVLPTLPHPLPHGLQEQLLWREPVRLVVEPDHPLARDRRAVPVEELGRHPLIVCRSAGATELEHALAARGLPLQPRLVLDSPQALVAMTRTGVGVGVATGVALAHADPSGLVVLDLDDPELVREVCVYWYDVLLRTAVGTSLLKSLLDAPPPPGAAAPRRRSPERTGEGPARRR